MSTTAATTVTSLDGFHATPTAQRADALARAFFDAVNADDPARTDAVLARSFLSYDVHGTRSRTGLRRYHSDLRRSFPDLRFEVHENVGVLIEGDLVALPSSAVQAANGINYAYRDTGSHEGNRALGIRGRHRGCQGLAPGRRAACRVLVRATTAGPVRSAARNCRSMTGAPGGRAPRSKGGTRDITSL